MALAINGTTGISGVDGSASAPAIVGSDSNTGFSFGSDTVSLNTGGTTRATIDSNGHLLVNTSSVGGGSYDQLSVAGGIKITDDSNSKLEIGRYSSSASNSYIKLGSNSDSLRITNAGDSADLFTITNAGKVGIGTTSPSCTGLNVAVNTTTTSRVNENTVQIQNTNDGASTCAGIVLAASTAANTEFNIVTQKHPAGSGADFFLDNGTKARMEMSGDNADIKFGVNGTMISTFTPGLSNNTLGLGLEPRNGSIFLSRSNGAALYVNTNTDGSQLATFRRNGNEQGKIIAHSQSVSYETTSDYRLKENAVAISDGITRLKLLKPYRFNFKNNSSETLDGFFAHEAQAVVPECASGTKDEVVVQAQVDSEVYKEEELGNPIYQGIDQSKLVPLLAAALQEAVGKIETFETKVAALEAA